MWRGGWRALLVVAGAMLFLGVASLIKPLPRNAEALPPGINVTENEIRGARPESAHPKGYKLIGTLEGYEHIVKCWATPNGPRYSVHALDGRLLQDDLPADEVYRGFPDVDLPNLRADPPVLPTGLLVDFVDVWRD